MDFRAHATEIDGSVRAAQLQGRDYLVAPVVLVREQVLNGDFLSAQAIERSVPGWNGVPVAVNHPTDENGEFVSANTPESIETHGIGHIFNSEYAELDDDDGSKVLRGEAWNDVERMLELGGEAEQVAEHLTAHALAAQDSADVESPESNVMDVSTGYFHERINRGGVHNGEQYRSEHTNVLPDHLAMLPNEKGACSTEDGCGTPRVNQV